MAMGAEVVIENIPGYLPSPVQGSDILWRNLRDNAISIFSEDEVMIGSDDPSPIKTPHGAVSDINDVANIMPKASFGVGGAIGVGHSRSYEIGDKYAAYVMPVKLYCAVIIDMLWDGAKLAKQVIDEYKPEVEKSKYMDYWKDILMD